MSITRRLAFSVLLVVGSLVVCDIPVRGQGSLTPPGAPAPTMKTLDQVEARTPLPGGTSALSITQDGSYYLTGNLTIASGSAINIAANNVTLDLNGFTITGTTTNANSAGIAVSYTGSGAFTLRNGHIRGNATFSSSTFSGSGFSDGVNVGGKATSARIDGVEVYGVIGNGITIAASAAVVSHCQTSITGGHGIFVPTTNSATSSSIDHCVQQTCGKDGITGGSVSDCYGASLYGYGILGASITNCTGTTNDGTAIDASGVANNCTATAFGNGKAIYATSLVNCYGVANQGSGIAGGNATNCYGSSVAGSGVYILNALNCEGLSTSGTGVQVLGGSASGCYGSSSGGTDWPVPPPSIALALRRTAASGWIAAAGSPPAGPPPFPAVRGTVCGHRSPLAAS